MDEPFVHENTNNALSKKIYLVKFTWTPLNRKWSPNDLLDLV